MRMRARACGGGKAQMEVVSVFAWSATNQPHGPRGVGPVVRYSVVVHALFGNSALRPCRLHTPQGSPPVSLARPVRQNEQEACSSLFGKNTHPLSSASTLSRLRWDSFGHLALGPPGAQEKHPSGPNTVWTRARTKQEIPMRK